MKTLRILILASTCFAVLFVLAPPTLGQNGMGGWLSYSAKFVCGREDPGAETIVGGRYRTVVNIHNPNYLTDSPATNGRNFPIPVVFYKKAVLALPQGNRPTPPSCLQFESLGADESLAVTCKNIKTLFDQSGIVVGTPFEGFLVVLVPPGQGQPPAQGQQSYQRLELDVTPVYTASQRLEDDGLQTIDVEMVKPREVRGNPETNLCDGDGIGGGQR